MGLVSRFMNSENVRELVVFYKEEVESLEVMEVQWDRNIQLKDCMIFMKQKVDQISSTNFRKEIQIVNGGSSNMLFNIGEMLKQVFLKQKGMDYNIIQQMQQLETNIGDSLKDNLEDEANINNLVRVEDEKQYWQNKYQESKEERAKYYYEKCEQVEKVMNQIESQELQGLCNSLEMVFQILDDIWEYTGDKNDIGQSGSKYKMSHRVQQFSQYQGVRMKRMLRIINNGLIERLKQELDEKMLWALNNNYRMVLQEVKKVVEYQERLLNRINYRQDQRWDKGVDEDYLTGLNLFQQQIGFIYRLRTQLEILKEFKDVNIADFEKYLQEMKVCISGRKEQQIVGDKFKEMIERNKKSIIEEIKKKIFKDNENINRMCQDYRKYGDIIGLIKEDIQRERESILQVMEEKVNRIENEFNEKNNILEETSSIQQSRSISQNVMNIVWSRQLINKLKTISNQCKQILNDLQQYQDLEERVKQCIESIEYYEQEQFDSWECEVLGLIKEKGNPLRPEMNENLLEMVDGELRVNFSERLILLIRETRQMIDMEPANRKVKRSIVEIVDNSKKYYKNAVKLKQIASFYNSMSSQIIESQQRMLVQEAMEFEDVINQWKEKSNRNIDNYVKNVEESYRRIIQESGRLRKVHEKLIDGGLQLLEVDVIQNNQLYKQKMNNMKNLIKQVVIMRDPKLTRPWENHWNWQIKKIEKIQQRKGLMSIVERMNRIEVEMNVVQKKVCCKPSLGEVKQKMYQQVMNYVIQFEGEEEEEDGEYLGVVYQQIEGVVSRLVEKCREMEQCNVLLYLDGEQVSQQMLEIDLSGQVWQQQIQNIRSKRREIQNIDDHIKIDCLDINTYKFKEQMDQQMRDWLDSMIKQINISIRSKGDDIEQYINKALEYYDENRDLSKVDGLDQYREIRGKNDQIMEKRNEMLSCISKLQEKSNILKYLGGVDIHFSQKQIQIQSRWENLQTIQNKYEEDLNDYQKNFKDNIQQRASKIDQDCDRFYQKWQMNRPKKSDTLNSDEVQEYSQKMKQWGEEWQSIQQQIEKINKESVDLGLEQISIGRMDEINKEIVEEQKIWADYDAFQSELEVLMNMKWIDLRMQLGLYQSLYTKYEEESRKKIKERQDIVVMYIYERADQLKQLYPTLKLIVGENFQQEHWKTLLVMIDLKSKTTEDLLFRDILEQEQMLRKKNNEIKELALRAQGEVSLREAVLELKVWLETTEFELQEHKTSKQNQISVIKEWKDLLTKVGDQQALLASLRDSKYVSRFVDQLEQFELKLGPMDEILRKLNQIQRKWVYLEPIFGRGALPNQQQRFGQLDNEYRMLMDNIARDSRVASFVTIVNIQKQLDEILENLEYCQKALNDFLEEKRNKFARFYFLGDDDLLEILGQSQNQNVIHLHLKKLYQGINNVQFKNGMDYIDMMMSNMDEKVELKSKVAVKGNEIEDWLILLTDEMKRTLTKYQIECYQEQSLEIGKYCSQILQVTENVRFNENCIQNLNNNSLLQYQKQYNESLQTMTKLCGNSKGLTQIKLKALILDIIHNQDVIQQLIEKEVKSNDDWYFFKQLRYLIDREDNKVLVQMCRCILNYSYEYQGNSQKLVHTPLTDKCYLTLIQGMHMGYGGNPYGPAGTGKTESVKALGQLLGRQVLVFNCDEGIDFRAMGRIFIGLVRTGSWGCFDEFNRLLEEQLSAISQQIQIIQYSIKQKQNSLELLGKTIQVNKEAAIFVTMNPAGKGYGGRSKLPDNLKQLFRPVAMTQPNNEQIAGVLLYAEGFRDANILAKKIVSLFLLSKQLLSKQQHYDWGLRALKTCLNSAGVLIQEHRNRSGSSNGNEQNDQVETELLIKSIRINTLSKLTHQDNIRFEQLLDDIFPGVLKKDIVYKELEEAIDSVLVDMRLEKVEKQIQKILQFNEAIRQRTGAVVVGPSGSGKSSIWKILQKAYIKMGEQVNTQIINPKALAKTQLLGYLNQDTREFNSGVLTEAARTAARESSMQWVICDGDIDPEWIEALNSVLDDNRLLTLPTGERISFGKNVNFIFETNDLQYASPATISRMGMILLSNEDLPYNKVFTRWINQQNEKCQNITKQYQKQIEQSIDIVLNKQTCVPTTQLSQMMSVLVQLQNVENKQQLVIGVVRGIVANLNPSQREQIVKTVFQIFNEPLNISLNMHNAVDFTLQSNGNFTLLDNKVSKDQSEIVEIIQLQSNFNIGLQYLLNYDPILIVGPEGCGKSLLVKYSIQQLKQITGQKINIATIHCNSQTTGDQIIQKLTQVCVKGSCAQGNILKPKDCNRLIIFLKDINLPKPDKYNTIQLIAFLQQLITHQGYFDDNLEFVYLDDKIQIICSMAPTTTMGRHALSSRFTASLKIININYPSTNQLQIIYEQFLQSVDQKEKVAKYLIELYQQINKNFTVDNQRHYIFTPRDLTKCVNKILKYNHLQIMEVLFWHSQRCFLDRIVDQQGRNQYLQIVSGLLKQHFNYDIRQHGQYIFTSLLSPSKIEKINLNDFNTLLSTGNLQQTIFIIYIGSYSLFDIQYGLHIF